METGKTQNFPCLASSPTQYDYVIPSLFCALVLLELVGELT